MRPCSQLIAHVALTLLSATFASSLQPNTVDCEIVTTGLSPSCWDELNMNAWMQNWSASTSPNATSGAAARCREDELWSTCFLRLGLGVTGRDCSTINDKSGWNATCVMPTLDDAPEGPQMFYGVWNIYAINNYFRTFSLALQTLSQTSPKALTTAATTSANGTSRFATTNSTQTLPIDIPLRILLEKETYGFALPATPNAALLTFLETHPAAQTQTYGQSTSVSELVGLVLQRLGQLLLRIMSDVPSFLMVADEGAFSTEEVVDGAGLVEVLES